MRISKTMTPTSEAQRRNQMKHETFVRFLGEMWSEFTKYDFGDFNFRLSVVLASRPVAFRIEAQWMYRGNHYTVDGPLFTLHGISDRETLTDHLRTVTEMVRAKQAHVEEEWNLAHPKEPK